MIYKIIIPFIIVFPFKSFSQINIENLNLVLPEGASNEIENLQFLKAIQYRGDTIVWDLKSHKQVYNSAHKFLINLF